MFPEWLRIRDLKTGSNMSRQMCAVTVLLIAGGLVADQAAS